MTAETIPHSQSGGELQLHHSHVYGKRQSANSGQFMHLCQNISAGFIISKLSAKKNGVGLEACRFL